MDSKARSKSIVGFSKLNKRGKIKWIVENFFRDPENVMHELMSYWHRNEDQQKVLDGFSENTITNFPMPFSVAPNVVVNGKTYCVPMVIEESSVVAAASSAAKFWMDRGGVRAEVLGTRKLGQVHFNWDGPASMLRAWLPEIERRLRQQAADIVANMEKRGGGIKEIELVTISTFERYYQLRVGFETCDSMGANFINTCLESFAKSLDGFFAGSALVPEHLRSVEVIMSILSNYTPECLVRARVECPVEALGPVGEMSAEEFAWRMNTAVEIAQRDPYRAVTHNKGILNGVDAVVIATGNDFRAVEACCHAFAAKDGQYRGLSTCSINNGIFQFAVELPLALGTIGGLTSLHPMAKRSLELLEQPDAEELMQITAATGLLQNFAAVRSLVTTGIQKGHMKMHLHNILHQLGASEDQKNRADEFFNNRTVSYNAVRDFLAEHPPAE